MPCRGARVVGRQRWVAPVAQDSARTLGPNDERSVLATALAACMFCFWASRPRMRAFWPCSWWKETQAQGVNAVQVRATRHGAPAVRLHTP